MAIPKLSGIWMQAVAYRAYTQALAMRCLEPGDAPALRALYQRIGDPLVPLVAGPGPRSLAAAANFACDLFARFERRQLFVYGAFLGEQLVGLVSIDPRHGGVAAVGWHFDVVAAGATIVEAVAAAARIAFEIGGTDWVETYGLDAGGSALASHLGFAPVADPTGDEVASWVMGRAAFFTGPGAAVPVSACDKLGRPLLA